MIQSLKNSNYPSNDLLQSSRLRDFQVKIEATFPTITAALSVVFTLCNYNFQFLCSVDNFQMLNNCNFHLKERAAASLRTDHRVYNVAAHYVKIMSTQVALIAGIPYSLQQSLGVKI